MIDQQTVAEVLRAAAIAKGRTDWMQAVLGSDHMDLLEWAVDNTDANTGPRELLVRAAGAVRERMVTPPDELVGVVTELVNQRSRT